MAKLLCSDYDGTLRVNQEVSKFDLEAINNFRSLGNKFGIVTGRSIGMIEYEVKHFHIPIDFLICNNGGIAVSANGEVLLRHDIDFEVSQAFISYIMKYPSIMLGCSDGDRFALIQEGEIKETPANFNTILGTSYTDINKILCIKKINSFFLKDSTLSRTMELYKELSVRYKDILAFHFNNGTIDVSAPGASKKNAIKELSQRYDIEGIYAIGDGYNDLEMIKEFGGFTVVNAPSEVKQHALNIFDNVCECVKLLMSI